jgi:osmotically-inducible protein OsmY
MTVVQTTRRNIITTFFLLILASCTIFSGKETTGQYVDDSTITTKIKDAFVADPDIHVYEIHVETMQGVVQLSGFVSTQTSKNRAASLANNVRGVRSVKNNIVVRSPEDLNH